VIFHKLCTVITIIYILDARIYRNKELINHYLLLRVILHRRQSNIQNKKFNQLINLVLFSLSSICYW